MAANLTPQYLDAESEYKKAQTAEERLACLRKMYTLLPKHKASEKLQADLKTKIKHASAECESDKHKKKGGVSYKIPRQGAGQVALVGPPNGGKSLLLSRLTRATPEVAPYPFTTHQPTAGMMDWEDVRVQLVDLPPITIDVMEGWVSSMVRSADAALLVVDLADEDGPFAAEATLEKLATNKTILTGMPPEVIEDFSIEHVRTMLVANKSDADGAADRLEMFREMFTERFPIHVVSGEHGSGMDELRALIFQFLNVTRVYSKLPGKPPDKTAPFTCPVGSTVAEFAGLVHRDFVEKLKSARIWGSGVFDGQAVGREHVVHDKDVVELHV
jgi:ribosome-interacting GTPase 1